MLQVDADATFTKKGSETHHGYKNHAHVDVKWKLIRAAEITSNAPQDSTEFESVLREGKLDEPKENRRMWGDSAYRSAEAEAMLRKKNLISHVHERAYRNHPLTGEQKAENRLKSTVCVRVEHVFGHMETAMGGLLIHTLGLARATVKITFKNLAYIA
jgi:transposase, IS5 family